MTEKIMKWLKENKEKIISGLIFIGILLINLFLIITILKNINPTEIVNCYNCTLIGR